MPPAQHSNSEWCSTMANYHYHSESECTPHRFRAYGASKFLIQRTPLIGMPWCNTTLQNDFTNHCGLSSTQGLASLRALMLRLDIEGKRPAISKVGTFRSATEWCGCLGAERGRNRSGA